jgi:hypothetical protein
MPEVRSNLPQDGLERYSTRRVVFARPFTLGKAPEVYAAGAYDVETKEQAVEGAGHVAHVRTSTILIIRTPTGTCSREVRGSELDHALSRDAEFSPQRDPSENPDRGAADATGGSGADSPIA